MPRMVADAGRLAFSNTYIMICTSSILLLSDGSTKRGAQAKPAPAFIMAD
jgi:hypothetical protein